MVVVRLLQGAECARVWESLSQNADGVPGCLADLRGGVRRGLLRNLRQADVAEPFDAAAVDDSEADVGSVKGLPDLPDLKKLQTRRKVLFQRGIAVGRLAGIDTYLPDGFRPFSRSGDTRRSASSPGHDCCCFRLDDSTSCCVYLGRVTAEAVLTIIPVFLLNFKRNCVIFR